VVRRAVAAAPLAALALAGAAHAAPNRGPEVLPTASVAPGPHLFGDRVQVELAVLVDPDRVDPDAVHVGVTFDPYAQVGRVDHSVDSAEGVVRLRYRYTLECLSDACLPDVGKAEKTIALPPATVRYRTRKGAAHNFAVRWPRFREIARFVIPKDLSSNFEIRTRLQFQNDPIVRLFARTAPPPPSYPLAPALLAALLAAAALACLAGAAVASRPLLAALAARRAQREERVTPLERALELVDRTSRRSPGTPEHREALGRLARELRQAGLRELVAPARRLAWSEGTPSRDESEALTRRVRSELGAAA
jgi:hypothetical protein